MRRSALLVLTLSLSAAAAVAADVPVLEVGKAAPELKLSAADGTSRSLEATDGSTVLIFYRGLW